MRLVSLRLLNFRQHADSALTFDSGLTGIIGPNGAGKSTILEAIAWALYGNAAARGTRESIRFVRAPARAPVRVELEFELAGHRYRVVRGLTSAEVFLDGAEAPIANSITGVSELLQRRIGMTRAEFFNTYFTGQKELNVMAAMGPSERAQFLSRVLGYEKLRAAQGLARERRKLVVAEIGGLKTGMPDTELVRRQLAEAEGRVAAARAAVVEVGRRHADATTRLAAVAPEWARAQQERERVQELHGEQRAAEGEVQGLVRELDRHARELVDAAAARAELARLAAALAPLPALQQELRTLDALGTAEGRRSALDDQERTAMADLAQIEERRARLGAAPEYERETQQLLAERKGESAVADADHVREHTAWVRDQQEAQTRLEALRTQYEEARKHRDDVAALGPESPCPTCTRPLGASYRTVLDTLDEQLDTLRADGQYYRGRVKQLESEPAPVAELGERRRHLSAEVATLERRLAKCQAAVLELAGVDREVAQRQARVAQARRALAQLPTGYDAARHAAVRAEVARLVPLESERARADALVSREAQALAAQARAAGALDAARGRLAAIAERRAAIAFSEERHAGLRQAHQDAADAARDAELALVRAQGEERAARDALAHAERQRAELARVEARLDALQTERRLHDELDRAYTDLRQDLNFQLRPELSELASGFLDQLTDGRYAELELDDQYNVVVLEDGVPKPVISGGEEDLANLVLRLAISQMIADRAGQSFSLLILDEVFGSLDETRRANVVELLRRLHDRFEQVVVITHIEDVREGLDRVLRVRFDETRGAAVVEEDDEPLPEPLGVLVDALEEVG